MLKFVPFRQRWRLSGYAQVVIQHLTSVLMNLSTTLQCSLAKPRLRSFEPHEFSRSSIHPYQRVTSSVNDQLPYHHNC